MVFSYAHAALAEISRLTRLITPVTLDASVYLKRDDLFSIQDSSPIRGGKLRQCLLMLETSNASRLISAASIHSPQPAIVAYAAQQFGLPSIILVGGKQETPSVQLARQFGANIVRCKSGRHTVLFSEARKLARATDYIIPFGMRPNKPDRNFYEICGAQLCNVPAHIRTIAIATGSGVTAAAVAYGMWREGRTNQQILMINVGPDRCRKVLETLQAIDPASAEWVVKNNVLRTIPLSEGPGFRYEAPVQFQLSGVSLHPLYEGKAFSWFVNHTTFDAATTLFWLTGPPLSSPSCQDSDD